MPAVLKFAWAAYSVLKSFEHCYSKNELNKINSHFSKLVITGIQPLFSHNDRSGLKRPTDSAMSTASGQVGIASGQKSTVSG